MALGAVAVLALLAGPAGAQTTTTVIPPNLPAGSTAIDGSVSSGTAYAARNSTASGDAVAINNSTASGCATAVNNSTASGDTCPRAKAADRPSAPAAPTAARLAITGSWSGELAAMAAFAMALGAGLIVAGRRLAVSRA